MKSLLALVALVCAAIVASTSATSPPCCPCGGGQDVHYEFVFPSNIKIENVHSVIRQIFLILIERGTLDLTTVQQLLITFQVPGDEDFPGGGGVKPFRPDEVLQLVIDGVPHHTQEFLSIIKIIIERQGTPLDFLKALLTFVVHQNVPLSQIIRIVIRYGVLPTFEVKPTFPTFPSISITPGRPHLSTVVITRVIYPEYVQPLIYSLLQVLTQTVVIKRQTVENILVTFNFPGDNTLKPGSGIKFTVDTLPTINIHAKVDTKFPEELRLLLENPNEIHLLKALLELVIDSGSIDVKTVHYILEIFYISAKITSRELPKEPEFPDSKIHPGQPAVSQFVITGVLVDDFIEPIINRLLEIVTKNQIFDVQTANRILVTFGVPARKPFVSKGVQPLSLAELVNIAIKTQFRLQRNSFRLDFAQLMGRPRDRSSQIELISTLTELLLNTGVFDQATALNILATFKFVANGRVTYLERPDFPDSAISAGKPSDSQITIQVIGEQYLISQLINRLLKILVDRSITDVDTANRIIVTFDIEHEKPFDPTNAKPLTPAEVLQMQFKADPIPLKKFFLQFISVLPGRDQPTERDQRELISPLMELLADLGIINADTVERIALTYRIGLEYVARLAPSFNDIQIRPGKAVNATITILRVDYADYLPDLVYRVLEILVKRSVLDQTAVSSILVTFNLPGDGNLKVTGGTALTETTMPKPNVHLNLKNKFPSWLATLLTHSNSPQAIVPLTRILLELLVDSGAVDVETLQTILQVYYITVELTYREMPDIPEFPDSRIRPGTPSISQIQITQVSMPDIVVQPLTRRLLDILIKSNVLELPTANRFLLTFRVDPHEPFSTDGVKPFEAFDVLTVSVKTKYRVQYQRFVTEVAELMPMPKGVQTQVLFIQELLELLLDTGVVSKETAQDILVTFKMSGTMTVSPIERPDFPAITPGVPSDSQITITSIVEQYQYLIPQLLHGLFKVIVSHEITTQATIERIIKTFDIEFEAPFNPTDAVSLTPVDIDKLTFNIDKVTRKKFILHFISILPKGVPTIRDQANVVDLLLETLIDLGIFNHETIIKIAETYRIGLNVNIIIRPIVKPEVIIPGKPFDVTIVIKDIVHRQYIQPFIYRLFEILINHKVFDDTFIKNLLITFNLLGDDEKFIPSGGVIITETTVPTIKINTQIQTKITEQLLVLLKWRNSPETLIDLVRLLLEIAAGSGAIDLPTLQLLLKIYYFTTEINFRELPEIPEMPKLQPGRAAISQMVITQVLVPDFLPPLINKLLEILVQQSVFDVPTSNRILATFGVASYQPFNSKGATPLRVEDVTQLPIKTEYRIQRLHFFDDFTLLFSRGQGTEVHAELISVLLELMINKGIIHEQSARDILLTFKMCGSITVNVLEKPVFPDIRPGKPSNSRIMISNVEPDYAYLIPLLLNPLFEILVKKQITDVQTINRIIRTFELEYENPFNPADAMPLTEDDCQILKINVAATQRKKFVNRLAFLLPQGAPTDMDQANVLIPVLELLLDLGVMDKNTVITLVETYKIEAEISVKPNIPKPIIEILPVTVTGPQGPEPSLIPGDRLPAGQLLVATVVFNNNLYPLAPFIVRLLQLLESKGVMDITTVSRVLTTFSIPGGPGGNALQYNGASITEIRLGSSPDAAKKFVASLQAIVVERNADNFQSNLVKFLLELLIENSVVDMGSVQKLCLHYGVGVKIDAQITSFKYEVQQPPKIDAAGFLSTLHITGRDNDAVALINNFLQRAIQSQLTDEGTATKLLITFGVLSPNALTDMARVGGFSLSTVTSLNCGGNSVSKQKFAMSLRTILSGNAQSRKYFFAMSLLEYLLENGALHVKDVMRVLRDAGFSVTGREVTLVPPTVIDTPICGVRFNSFVRFD